MPAVQAGGRERPGLVLDLDATLITSHSEMERAAPTYKGGFGFHPLLCFLANTGEAMSGRLRPGNSGAGTAADPCDHASTSHAPVTPSICSRMRSA
ncbi:transposase [Streptomyces scopuliridis]